MANSDLLISEYIEGSSNNKAIEIYNGTDGAIDLAPYTLEIYFNGSTTAGTTISLTGNVAAGDVYVVADNDANSSILAETDQTSTASFFNGDDAIALSKDGTVIDSIGQIGVDPGSEWGSGDTSTQDNTLRRQTSVTEGDTDPFDPFDPAAEWTGFPADTVDGLGVYPDGEPPEPPEPPTFTPIYDIQGAGHVSPLVLDETQTTVAFFDSLPDTSSISGESVTTTGIVTAVDTNGFYLQDAIGDGDIATSDAIFVFTGDNPEVNLGDELQVTGTVSEFFPGGTETRNLPTTQISGNLNIEVLSTGNTLPDAVIIGQDGRIPPDRDIDEDAFVSFDPQTDGIDFFESLEAMRVTAQDTVAIAGTNRFGEIFTVVENGASATGISDRGTLNISPDDFNPERVQIDEDSGILPDFELPIVDTGARLGDVTGVVGYSFGNFEIYPTEPFSAIPSSLEPEVTNLEGGQNQLTVATYNVLNLDPNDEDGDTDIADGRFEAIAQQVVDNLKTPDILALQEVQDNSGSVDDGTVAADETLQLLIDEIAAAGGPQYEFIDNTFISDGASGGQPGGNIRTSYLYNPDRVGLVEGSVQTIGSQAPGEAFNGARLPLVATFEFNGEEITVVNNHFSSKGGSAPILGIEQPFEELQEDENVNGSLDERQAQSAEVQDFVTDTLSADSNANVAVVGDLNEFEFVSPVTGLEDAGLTNLVNTLDPDERYSFIFQGNSQELDHILISDSLNGTAEFDIVHVNAEFAETDSRASDHEPLLASLNLGSTTGEEIFGTRRRDNLVGTEGNDLIAGLGQKDTLNGLGGDDTLIGDRGNDNLTGGSGSDLFVYNKIGDRLDTITDFEAGQDKIDLSNIFARSIYGSSTPFDDYVELSQAGANTIVRVDPNGDLPNGNNRPLLFLEDTVASDLSADDFIV